MNGKQGTNIIMWDFIIKRKKKIKVEPNYDVCLFNTWAPHMFTLTCKILKSTPPDDM